MTNIGTENRNNQCLSHTHTGGRGGGARKRETVCNKDALKNVQKNTKQIQNSKRKKKERERERERLK